MAMHTGQLATGFRDLYDSFIDGVDEEDRPLIAAIQCVPTDHHRTYGFDDLGSLGTRLLGEIARLPEPRASTASRAVIAGLAAANADTLNANLTEQVRDYTVAGLERLLVWLSADTDRPYRFPDDYFLKDYRFVSGMTVPCGAQAVDLLERPGMKTMAALVTKAPAVAWAAAVRPWFKPHTESRYLDHFNETGWDSCYATMADLMTLMPRTAGMVATSWFYHPMVAEISPRLAYLQRVPLTAGAIAVRHGTTQFDIESATATSASRRTLYEEGKYTPECWSIIWPRDALLNWARDHRRSMVQQ